MHSSRRTHLPVFPSGGSLYAAGASPLSSEEFGEYEFSPLASGPGIFGSELDAAYEDIKPFLNHEQREEFSSETRVDDQASGAVSKGGAPKMRTQDLYDLAMLVTGRWGHQGMLKVGRQTLPDGFEAPAIASGKAKAPATKRQSWSPRKTEEIFGVAGQNLAEDVPAGPGVIAYELFWSRMARLRGALDLRLERARAAYAGQSSIDDDEDEDGDQKETWVVAIQRMISAVDHVIAQHRLPARDRSVFLTVPSGARSVSRPFGLQWGVLAGDGNAKLPYVSYSELPMSTCPGAGACGVYRKDTTTGGPSGYCYSFKAWRYPAAFARQFLNTLANYADREFRIAESLAPKPLTDIADDASPETYWRRTKASLARPYRPWIKYVAEACLVEAARTIERDIRGNKIVPTSGRVVFVRLFVDGDIGAEDGIVSWMLACRSLANQQLIRAVEEKSGLPRGSIAPMQVYGYSKCWQQFVNVGKMYGCSIWPDNYIVNMSDASQYRKIESIRTAMEQLPITRGYFNVIELSSYLKDLKEVDPTRLQLPERPPLPSVTLSWLQGIAELGRVTTVADAEEVLRARFGIESFIPRELTAPRQSVLWVRREGDNEYQRVEVDPSSVFGTLEAQQTPDAPYFKQIKGKKGAVLYTPFKRFGQSKDGKERMIAAPSILPDEPKRTIEQRAIEQSKFLRQDAIDMAVKKMLSDPGVALDIKNEISRDVGYLNAQDYLDSFARGEAKGQKRKGKPDLPFIESEKRQHDKILTLLTHSIFLAARYDKAGSCPLVCGNCVDVVVDKKYYKSRESFLDIPAATGAVHRCASKRPADAKNPPVKVCAVRAPDTRPGYYGADIHIGLH